MASWSAQSRLAAALVGIFLSSIAFGQPAPVTKTNPMKVYMHYMPWFQTPSSQGGTGGSQWGWHWKMNTKNPNIVDATGKRQIAAHYYPMIGPYDSSDPDVIEYHLLLMKYSGVDGLMIDWYGVAGWNDDIVSLRVGSENMIRKVDDFGLKFSVVMEDRFSTVSKENPTPDINKGLANMEYLRHNPDPPGGQDVYPNYPGYFENPDYIRLGAGQDPLVGIFGPTTFQTPSQWTTIMTQAGEDLKFLPLWYQSGEAGANADGEHAWIYEDENLDDHFTHQSNFYRFRAPTLDVAGGVAYPGFNDFYFEGGDGPGYFEISHDNGQTLDAVLDLAETYASRIDFLQLATFNDFGEGTMFEPTIENGFDYLKTIQEYTGVTYGEAELRLIYRLYLARKKYGANASIDASLDEVSELLASLDIASATSLLNSVAPIGDYNANGSVDAADYTTWSAKFGTSTILYGSGADGGFDGFVDAADYVLWRHNLSGGGGAGLTAPSVPEPSTTFLLAFVAAALCSASGQRNRAA